jgi:hypothetical protein
VRVTPAVRVCMWVNKFPDETTVTASFPNHPIAHDSETRSLEALRSVLIRAAAAHDQIGACATALSRSDNTHAACHPLAPSATRTLAWTARLPRPAGQPRPVLHSDHVGRHSRGRRGARHAGPADLAVND